MVAYNYGARIGVAGIVVAGFRKSFKALTITSIEAKFALSLYKAIPRTSPSKLSTSPPAFDFVTLILISFISLLLPSKRKEDIVAPITKIFCPIFILLKSPKAGTAKTATLFPSIG